jgi:hypothetical protein
MTTYSYSYAEKPICISSMAFVMEMPELQRRNISVGIRIWGNQTDVSAKVHLSLRGTDAFMSPPYGGSGKRNMQKEGNYYMMPTITHRLAFMGSQTKQTSQTTIWCTLREKPLHPSNLQLVHGLQLKYNNFTSSFVDGLYIKLYMNLTSCVTYIMMREHSHGVE